MIISLFVSILFPLHARVDVSSCTSVLSLVVPVHGRVPGRLRAAVRPDFPESPLHGRVNVVLQTGRQERPPARVA